MKIRLVGAEFLHTDRRTERQKKLTVAFRNFGNTSKNCYRPIIVDLVAVIFILNIALN